MREGQAERLVARRHQDIAVAAQSPGIARDGSQQTGSIQPGHHHIQQDSHWIGRLAQMLQRLKAILRLRDGIARIFQHIAQCLANGCIVVDNEDVRLAGTQAVNPSRWRALCGRYCRERRIAGLICRPDQGECQKLVAMLLGIPMSEDSSARVMPLPPRRAHFRVVHSGQRLAPGAGA